jgi:uncharacterized damage-inducible protein DinB
MKNHSKEETQIITASAVALKQFATAILGRLPGLNHNQTTRIASGVFASLLLLCAITLSFYAQQPAASARPTAVPDNPLSTFTNVAHTAVDFILLSSAQKMPEENYSFKPTDSVRSYGQIVGHLADAHYMFCSTALGEKDPGLKIEQSKTSKADLIAALKESFAYCDKAYNSVTDASGSQMVNLFGRDTPRLGVLIVNNMHNMEHYGNLVTYMRLKNVVPPTSEPDFNPMPRK